ncbi:hypothetical protein [Brevibacillus migulae]|uniref:hypothetical protein n=1 Tax=Brevibacillus migulae TaxID=1644114 RepID=UPI00106DD708|nr:hypothetical protein [Brevibacillus migulae]
MPLMQKYVALMIGCLLLTSCATASQHSRFDRNLEEIDRVSVLSLDGQEIELPLAIFLGELKRQGLHLEPSDEEFHRDEMMYTLLVHRRSESPLVIQVGKNASQFGNTTYIGEGAKNFYRWIRKLTAESLFSSRLQEGEIRAEDLNRERMLEFQQRNELEPLLQRAVYHASEESRVYPLYPDYRLKLHYEDRITEVRILTPTLAAVNFGSDIFYYEMPKTVHDRVAEWLSPQILTGFQMELLFQSNLWEIIREGDLHHAVIWDMEKTPDKKTYTHQMVRVFLDGIPLAVKPTQPGAERFRFYVSSGEKKQTIIVYDHHFVLYDHVYQLHDIGKTIESLLK